VVTLTYPCGYRSGHRPHSGTRYPDPDIYRSPAAAREYFEEILPKIERKASTAFMYLNASAREEAVAEAVALSWKGYLRCIEKSKRFTPWTLAYYAIRQVRSGVRFNGTYSADVLSERTRILRGTRVASIDATPAGQPYDDARSWWDRSEALMDRRNWDRPDEAVRISHDYGAFLTHDGLKDRHRRVFDMLAEGYRPSEIAAMLDVSRARVTQVKRELRKGLKRFFGPEIDPGYRVSQKDRASRVPHRGGD
jgi:DNA-binding NarL/FixJ family response regulator